MAPPVPAATAMAADAAPARGARRRAAGAAKVVRADRVDRATAAPVPGARAVGNRWAARSRPDAEVDAVAGRADAVPEGAAGPGADERSLLTV